jgi:integral membrane protein (TIGR01906 family)
MNIAENRRLYRGLSLLVALLVPVVLGIAAVRLVLTPLYLEIIYRTPGFPDDPHGFYLPPELRPFTLQDRLYYANNAREYLLNDAGISHLGDLRFPAGQQVPPNSCQFMDDCTRLYNDRELQHMIDVKVVTQGALRVGYLSLAVVLGLGVWAWSGGWLREFRSGLRRGGWLAVILVGLILLAVIAFFGVFFVFFHNVFFAAGTWMFWSSDTLIRLFPELFWRNTFLAVGLLTTLLGLLVVWLAPKLRRPGEG